MTPPEFPEKSSDRKNVFNRLTQADFKKMSPEQQFAAKEIEARQTGEQADLERDQEAMRESAVEARMDQLLRQQQARLEGPKPVIGGERADKSSGVWRRDLTPEQQQDLRKTAEGLVIIDERKKRVEMKRAHEKELGDFIDRALGRPPNTDRGRERSR